MLRPSCCSSAGFSAISPIQFSDHLPSFIQVLCVYRLSFKFYASHGGLIGCVKEAHMRQTDVAIVGGGLAGSTAAAMLGRAGIAVALIDPHKVYPPEFRCEKLGGKQIETIHKTGLYDAIRHRLNARRQRMDRALGRLLDNKPSDQHGVLYDDLVNTIRREIPPAVDVIESKATSIATSADRQTIVLSDGESISARLVVLANGLSIGLRHALGIERTVISACHSITVGFNIVPAGQERFRVSGADLLYGKLRRADGLSDVVFRSATRCAPT